MLGQDVSIALIYFRRLQYARHILRWSAARWDSEDIRFNAVWARSYLWNIFITHSLMGSVVQKISMKNFCENTQTFHFSRFFKKFAWNSLMLSKRRKINFWVFDTCLSFKMGETGDQFFFPKNRYGKYEITKATIPPPCKPIMSSRKKTMW